MRHVRELFLLQSAMCRYPPNPSFISCWCSAVMLRLRREGQRRGGWGKHKYPFEALGCLGPDKRAQPGYSLSQVTIETGSEEDLAPKTLPKSL